MVRLHRRGQTQVPGDHRHNGTGFLAAPEGSVEQHRANLADADRQLKLQLGEWQYFREPQLGLITDEEAKAGKESPIKGWITGWKYSGRFHPAATLPTTKEIHVATSINRKRLILAWARGPSAKDFILQCRNEALSRLEKLEAEQADTSLEQEAFEQAPELAEQVELAGSKRLGEYELKKLLVHRIRMQKISVRLFNRKARKLMAKCERGEISPEHLSTSLQVGRKVLALA
jgi:hypothetical protein